MSENGYTVTRTHKQVCFIEHLYGPRLDTTSSRRHRPTAADPPGNDRAAEDVSSSGDGQHLRRALRGQGKGHPHTHWAVVFGLGSRASANTLKECPEMEARAMDGPRSIPVDIETLRGSNFTRYANNENVLVSFIRGVDKRRSFIFTRRQIDLANAQRAQTAFFQDSN